MVKVLKVQLRDRAGKGAARAIRRESLIPAVMYGAKQKPVKLKLDPKNIYKELETGFFFNTVYELEYDGKKQKVLPKDVQFHVVKDTIEHIDFLTVTDTSVVKVFIPIIYKGIENNAAVSMGGNLQIVRRKVELMAVASKIPNTLEVDVTKFKFGEIIRMSEVSLEEGLSPVIQDRDFVLASMKSPKGASDISDDENTEEDKEE